MDKRRSYLLVAGVVMAIILVFSCDLNVNNAYNGDPLENVTYADRSYCIGYGPEVSNIDIINNFLKDLKTGKEFKLLSYLANDIEWTVAGNRTTIPFAGTYNRISEASRYLHLFYRTIKINDLVAPLSPTEVEPNRIEAYIRLQGKVYATGRIFDIQFLYTWQLNEKRRIEKITVDYPLVAMELAFTRGGKGEIVAHLSASAQALYITNTVMPVTKARLAAADTIEKLRPIYTAPMLPPDAYLEEISINNIPGDIVHMIGERTDKIIFHMHGGGLVMGSKLSGRVFDYRLAKELNIPVINVNYKLAPENPFPAGLNDCYAVYLWLLEKYESKNIIFLGDSAGGNLIFAVTLLAKSNHMPLPGAILGMSPWIDLSNSGETMLTNAASDTYIPKIFLDRCANWYLNGKSPVIPFANPLYGDVTGFPPVYMSTVTNELLLSDSTRMFNKLARSRNDVTIEIASNLCHVFAGICYGTEDSERSIATMLKFIRDKVDF